MSDKISNNIIFSMIANKIFSSEIVHTMIKQFSPYITDHINFLSEMTGRRHKLAKIPFLKDGENTLIVRFVPVKSKKDALGEGYTLTISYNKALDTYSITPIHIPALGPVQKGRTRENMYFDSFESPDLFWRDFRGKE